jgi:hypothetical protein
MHAEVEALFARWRQDDTQSVGLTVSSRLTWEPSPFIGSLGGGQIAHQIISPV